MGKKKRERGFFSNIACFCLPFFVVFVLFLSLILIDPSQIQFYDDTK